MQGGVFGGICLLACLLSGVQGEESDVLKQEESNLELMKGKELSSEDEDSKKLKVASNDLNITQSSVPSESFKKQLSSEVSGESSNGPKSKQKTTAIDQKDTNNTNFNPRFSENANHFPASGAVAPPDQVNNDKTLPSFSYNSLTSLEESRRDTNTKSDGKQARNVDGSQSSENMNAYPFSSPSKSDFSESNDLRSGAPIYSPFENIGMNSAQAYAGALTDSVSQKNQGYNPYSYGYPPGPDINPGNIGSANAFAQVSSGSASAQSSAIVIEDAQSRVIWPSELIFPSKIHGSENTIQCSKENELYHFWSRSFECLVCVCLNIYGLLEPACAKCSGCRHHTPSQLPPLPPDSFVPFPLSESFVPMPLPNVEPYSPSASAPSLTVEPINEPDSQTTQHPPVQEVKAACSPLPIGKPYTNPLHPCQLCTCTELVNESGAVDVIIQCQDNLECVLPADVTTLPPIPDIPVPVPLPLCEKFPHHVQFPHPTERCKVCKCSLEVSQTGALEEQITCYHDTDCDTATPPAPPIPIPVEPYPVPIPEPALEPIPENISVPVQPPNWIKPSTPKDLLPWPPVSTPAPALVPLLPKKGPLPGPSPHDSCRPYPPNQPFQHPWDDCQICQCTVIKAIGVVNVEITCYTKLSCCIESPEQAISAIAENGVTDNENNQALQNNYLSSSVKPPTPINTYKPHIIQNIDLYNPGSVYNQAYATANAISQNLGDSLNQGYAPANAIPNKSGDYLTKGYAAANAVWQKSGDPLNQGYASANTISQNSEDLLNQGYAVANAISQNSEDSLNQGYAEANAISQNSGDSINQGYSEAKVISLNPIESLNQAYAAANVGANNLLYNQGDYNLQGFDNQGHAATNAIGHNSSPYISKYLRSQDSVEVNALAQSDMERLSNQLSGPYQSPHGSGQSLAEENAVYSSQGSFEPYKARIPHNQDLPQNTINNSLYPGSYNSAKTFSSANGQAVADSDAEYSSLPLISPYDTEVPKNPTLLSSIKTTEKLFSTTYKPPTHYDSYKLDAKQNNLYPEAMPQYNDRRTNTQKSLNNGQLSPGFSQNEGSAKANGQYSSILASTFKPPALYNKYNPLISQNPVRATPNAVYKELDKLPSISNRYNSGGTQNSLAEAIAQSQDYSMYYQPGASFRPNSYGLPYQPNSYYQNPQPLHSNKINAGLKGQYKKSPVKYAGTYDFNGQPDKIYSSHSGFNPYTGHFHTMPTSNLYSSGYPNNYDITPLYHPGQYGSNVQSSAEAYAASKLQSKSGYTEDSDESR